jgi:hypothetical protein
MFVVRVQALMRMSTVASWMAVRMLGTMRSWELVSKITLESMDSLARRCRLSCVKCTRKWPNDENWPVIFEGEETLDMLITCQDPNDVNDLWIRCESRQGPKSPGWNQEGRMDQDGGRVSMNLLPWNSQRNR